MKYRVGGAHAEHHYQNLSLGVLLFKSKKGFTKSTKYNDQYTSVHSVQAGGVVDSYGLAVTVIAIEARLLPSRGQTIITQAMAEEISALLAAHKIHVADYLLDGLWHQEEDGNLILNVKPKCLFQIPLCN